MMRSLYAGVSGLRNHQTRMDVIGNNISNVNTIGFKGSRVSFQDMLSQTLQGATGGSGDRGGTNPIQVGMGVGVGSIDTIFTDGNLQTTGKQTDLAISGQGFFVLNDGLNQLYTRSGGFDYDTSGNLLVPGTGYKVMGYKADTKGIIDPNQPLQNIQIPVGSSTPSKGTSTVTYAHNLAANAKPVGTAELFATAVADLAAAKKETAAAAENLKAALALKPTADDTAAAAAILANEAAFKAATDAAAQTEPAATPASVAEAVQKIAPGSAAATAATDAILVEGATAASVVDAVNVALTTARTAATTTATATAIADAKIRVATASEREIAADAAVVDASDKSSETKVSINVYDSQGNAYELSGTFAKNADNTWSFITDPRVRAKTGEIVGKATASVPITVEFNSDGSFKRSTPSATIAIDQSGLTPPSKYAGAGVFSVTPNFSTMTQMGNETTVQATGQDGYAAGTLEKTSINAKGIIIGEFNNGQTLGLAQIALSTFNNPSGLGKTGDNLYMKTTNSGEAQIGIAGIGGRGSFNSGALEMSNVDLTQQFSDMIVTQRGFQANSKIVTTTDTMMEEVINLKR